MRTNEMLENLLNNLETHNTFYVFNRVPLREGSTSFVYNSANPIFENGFEISLPYKEFISDIAYEENGKLYQILSNVEVMTIKEGLNRVNNDVILAAHNIHRASSEELRHYKDCMSKVENIYSYRRVVFKNTSVC